MTSVTDGASLHFLIEMHQMLGRGSLVPIRCGVGPSVRAVRRRCVGVSKCSTLCFDTPIELRPGSTITDGDETKGEESCERFVQVF